MLVDLDGTVIDNKLTAEQAWASVCREASAVVQRGPRELQDAIRVAADWFWSDLQRGHEGRIELLRATTQIVERALSSLGVVTHPLAHEIAAAFRARRDEFVLLPHSVDALEQLRAAGVRLALMTNGAGDVQREKIDRFDLCRHFDCVLIEGELGFGKPDERVYRNALTELGGRPSEAWAVGDNLEWEVAAPQRVGIYGVWVDQAGAGVPADVDIHPDRIIRSLKELVERE